MPLPMEMRESGHAVGCRAAYISRSRIRSLNHRALSHSASSRRALSRKALSHRAMVHLPSRSLPVATASRRWPCFLTASRRWPWRAATSTRPKRMFRDRTRPHLACFARCPPKVQSSRGRRNNLTFSFGKHARTTCISLFSGQTATRSFLHFSSSAPFFSHLQASFR